MSRLRFPQGVRHKEGATWVECWPDAPNRELRAAVGDADRGDWSAARERLLRVLLLCAEGIDVCDARLRGEVSR